MLIQGNRPIPYAVAWEHKEVAAREGYCDRIAGRGFSSLYDAAPAIWQRNYEIGRLWASGMIVCGIEPPEWPADLAQQPYAITLALGDVNSRIGILDPLREGQQPADPDLPTLHTPLRIPRHLRRVA